MWAFLYRKQLWSASTSPFTSPFCYLFYVKQSSPLPPPVAYRVQCGEGNLCYQDCLGSERDKENGVLFCSFINQYRSFVFYITQIDVCESWFQTANYRSYSRRVLAMIDAENQSMKERGYHMIVLYEDLPPTLLSSRYQDEEAVHFKSLSKTKTLHLPKPPLTSVEIKCRNNMYM